MADSFHFSISMISRGKSKLAVASVAYISCEKLTNEWDGVTHDYHNKKGLLYSQIYLPENIPKELSFEENKNLITDFIQENFVSKGMIADLAVHDESNEGNNNIHVHIMTTLRPINEKGQWQAKSKKDIFLMNRGTRF